MPPCARARQGHARARQICIEQATSLCALAGLGASRQAHAAAQRTSLGLPGTVALRGTSRVPRHTCPNPPLPRRCSTT